MTSPSDSSVQVEALACPFCGGLAITREAHHMCCIRCGADGPDADHLDDAEAIAAWNRRAALPVAPSDAEILEIAHRKASTYAHRSDPSQHAYGFVRHTLLDFARALLRHSEGKE